VELLDEMNRKNFPTLFFLPIYSFRNCQIHQNDVIPDPLGSPRGLRLFLSSQDPYPRLRGHRSLSVYPCLSLSPLFVDNNILSSLLWVGLTSGLVLQERGHVVDIWAKDLPPNTTSNKAGAYWFPYNIGPVSRVEKWAQDTYSYYSQVLQHDPQAACSPIPFVDFHNDDDGHHRPRFYESFVNGSRAGRREETAPGFTSSTVFETFSIDVDACLTYYVSKFRGRGGRITRREVKQIDEAFGEYDIVVNCTGLGARDLFNDQTLYAARGQTLLVRHNGHPCVSSVHNESVTYIIPRGDSIVLGGTFQKGNESVLVSEADTADIIHRCAAIHPSFQRERLEIVSEKVGLRPCRPEVRLETETFHLGKKAVIHNYGHGELGPPSLTCAATTPP